MVEGPSVQGGQGKGIGSGPTGEVPEAGAGWEPLVLDQPPASSTRKQEVANGRGPPPRDRPFRRGLLFAVLTMGLYALWWHRVVHKELCGFLGRADRERGLWGWFVGAHLFVWVAVVGSVAISVASSLGGSGAMAGVALLAEVSVVVPPLVLLAAIASVVLFIMHVNRQIEVLEEGKGRLGVPMRTTPLRFFGLFFGGVVLQPLAYWFLQEDYNDVHHEAGTEARSKGSPTTRPFA